MNNKEQKRIFTTATETTDTALSLLIGGQSLTIDFYTTCTQGVDLYKTLKLHKNTITIINKYGSHKLACSVGDFTRIIKDLVYNTMLLPTTYAVINRL